MSTPIRRFETRYAAQPGLLRVLSDDQTVVADVAPWAARRLRRVLPTTFEGMSVQIRPSPGDRLADRFGEAWSKKSGVVLDDNLSGFVDRLSALLPYPITITDGARTPAMQARRLRGLVDRGYSIDKIEKLYGRRSTIREITALPQDRWEEVLEDQFRRGIMLSDHMRVPPEALDVRSRDLTEAQKDEVVAAAESLGVEAFVEDRGKENEHVHVEEVRGFGGPAPGSDDEIPAQVAAARARGRSLAFTAETRGRATGAGFWDAPPARSGTRPAATASWSFPDPRGQEFAVLVRGGHVRPGEDLPPGTWPLAVRRASGEWAPVGSVEVAAGESYELSLVPNERGAWSVRVRER